MRCLIVRSHDASKPRDWYLKLSDRSEIWQAPWQHCCRCACQISEWYDNLNYQSHSFESSRDLMIERLIGYWNRVLVRFPTSIQHMKQFQHNWNSHCCQCTDMSSCLFHTKIISKLRIKLIHVSKRGPWSLEQIWTDALLVPQHHLNSACLLTDGMTDWLINGLIDWLID